MTTLSVNVRERFTNLRKKLDQLGYLQPLSLDSLPLVESIFTDLLWTTDSFRKNKSELDKRLETRERIEEYIEPYKRDNGRVLGENTRLQKTILNMKIEHEDVVRDLKCHVRQLEDEKEDLNRFGEQCLNKLKKYEVDAKEMIDKIVQLQEKNMQAVVHTSDGKQKSIAFRRQRMDIHHFIPKSNEISDDNGNSLCFKCGTTLGNYSNSEKPDETVGSTECTEMLNCVTLKCQELTKQLQRAHHEIELGDRRIEGYVCQMKLYEGEMDRLSKELSGGRNLEAMTIEQESKTKERLIAQLNMQLDLLQQRNEELEKEICRTNALNIKEGKHVSRKEINDDKRISDLEEENKRLRDKLNLFMDKEKDVLKQVNKQKTDKLVVSKNIQQNQQIADLKNQIYKLEDECEHCHEQIEEMRPIKQQIVELSNQNKELVELVEKMQNETINQSKNQKQFIVPVRDDMSTEEESNYKLQKEIARVKKEKTNLQDLLNKFERQLHDIQGNIRVLTQERDNINEKYLQTQKENQDLRASLLCASNESSSHANAQVFSQQQQVLLRRLELERNQALSDLHRMTTERDSLREQLQVTTQTTLTEKSRMQQTLEEIEEENKRLQDKIKKVRINSGQSEEKMRQLQNKKEELEECLKDCQVKLCHNGKQQEDYERRLKEFIKKEEENKRELEQSEKRIRKLQQNSQEKHEDLQEKTSEVSKLRSILSELDQEKDQLQNELDHKSEDCLSLQQEFDRKHQNLEELRSQVVQLESQIQRVEQSNNHREQEMRATFLQNEQLEHEMRRLNKCYDEQKVEMASMNDKMLKMSRDNKKLDSEMRNANLNYEKINEDLKNTCLKLEQSEKMRLELQTKNNEVIDQYREINVERDRCQRQLEEQKNWSEKVHCEIDARKKIESDLREQIITADREINRLQDLLQGSEAKLQNMNCVINTNDEAVTSLKAEKQQILGELSSMRDLCQRLEVSKDQLSHQLSSRMLEFERMNGENAELKRELDSAKNKVKELCSSLDDMETMVSVGRQKEFRETMDNQQKFSELESEIDQLRQCKAQVDHLSRELGQANSRISELEMDNDRLKRQLTSEKFKVEMVNQELKRRQQQPQSKPKECTPKPKIKCQPKMNISENSTGLDVTLTPGMHDDGPSNRSKNLSSDVQKNSSSNVLSPRISNSYSFHNQEEDDCSGEISKGYTSNIMHGSKSSEHLPCSSGISNEQSMFTNMRKSSSKMYNSQVENSLFNQNNHPLIIRCNHGCYHDSQCKSMQKIPRIITQKICAHAHCKHTKKCLNSAKIINNNQMSNNRRFSATDNSSVGNCGTTIVYENGDSYSNKSDDDNENNHIVNDDTDDFDATEVTDTIGSYDNSSSGIQTGRSVLSNDPTYLTNQQPLSTLESVLTENSNYYENSSSINNQISSLATVTMSSVVANSNQFHQLNDDESEL